MRSDAEFRPTMRKRQEVAIGITAGGIAWVDAAGNLLLRRREA